jgi:hypothetical protein
MTGADNLPVKEYGAWLCDIEQGTGAHPSVSNGAIHGLLLPGKI